MINPENNTEIYIDSYDYAIINDPLNNLTSIEPP